MKPGTTFTDARESREFMAVLMRARTDQPLHGSFMREGLCGGEASYCFFGLCLQSMIDETPGAFDWEYEWYETGGRSISPVGVIDLTYREHFYSQYDMGHHLGLATEGVDKMIDYNDTRAPSWDELADLLMEQEYFVIEGT